jgi:hypothetical protein
VKLIAESFRKIVAGSGPSPDTRIALLNQITLPSAIGIGLKESCTALAAVQELPEVPPCSPPPDPGFTETAAEAGAAIFWKLPLASETSPKPIASDKIPAQIRHFLSRPAESVALRPKELRPMMPTS